MAIVCSRCAAAQAESSAAELHRVARLVTAGLLSTPASDTLAGAAGTLEGKTEFLVQVRSFVQVARVCCVTWFTC